MTESDTIQQLLQEAQSLKTPKPKPSPAEVALEMYEVVGTLSDKGLTYKKMIAWFKKRGYDFKYHHLKAAVRKYERDGDEDEMEQKTQEPQNVTELPRAASA